MTLSKFKIDSLKLSKTWIKKFKNTHYNIRISGFYFSDDIRHLSNLFINDDRFSNAISTNLIISGINFSSIEEFENEVKKIIYK